MNVTVTDSLQQEVPAGPGIQGQFEIAQFESGQLEVVANDGSSLVLDAAAGGPETVDITIAAPDGSSVAVEQLWSMWAHQLTCG